MLSRPARACAGRSFAQRRDTAIVAVRKASGIRLSEPAGVRYDPGNAQRSDVDLWHREITVRGRGGKPRIVKISYDAARSLDRFLLERDAELGRLSVLLDRARDGQGAAVAIEGPAGIGKTGLLAAVRRLAAERGFRSLKARGRERNPGWRLLWRASCLSRRCWRRCGHVRSG
ncbi:MAG: AAA family ATPase [Streptosporangiaceae bacterium]